MSPGHQPPTGAAHGGRAGNDEGRSGSGSGTAWRVTVITPSTYRPSTRARPVTAPRSSFRSAIVARSRPRTVTPTSQYTGTGSRESLVVTGSGGQVRTGRPGTACTAPDTATRSPSRTSSGANGPVAGAVVTVFPVVMPVGHRAGHEVTGRRGGPAAGPRPDRR